MWRRMKAFDSDRFYFYCLHVMLVNEVGLLLYNPLLSAHCHMDQIPVECWNWKLESVIVDGQVRHLCRECKCIVTHLGIFPPICCVFYVQYFGRFVCKGRKTKISLLY